MKFCISLYILLNISTILSTMNINKIYTFAIVYISYILVYISIYSKYIFISMLLLPSAKYSVFGKF